MQHPISTILLALSITTLAACIDSTAPDVTESGTTIVDRAIQNDAVSVSKCFTNATTTSGGEMLIKAKSSDANASLFAYRPDGTLIGPVQNGGGSRYGGTVMPYQSYDPGEVTITSSSGGSITVPTTPFQL